jgi:hypothetical protein
MGRIKGELRAERVRWLEKGLVLEQNFFREGGKVDSS